MRSGAHVVLGATWYLADALAALAERLGCPSWGGWVNKVKFILNFLELGNTARDTGSFNSCCNRRFKSNVSIVGTN
jgi:hypothetical protein